MSIPLNLESYRVEHGNKTKLWVSYCCHTQVFELGFLQGLACVSTLSD